MTVLADGAGDEAIVARALESAEIERLLLMSATTVTDGSDDIGAGPGEGGSDVWVEEGPPLELFGSSAGSADNAGSVRGDGGNENKAIERFVAAIEARSAQVAGRFGTKEQRPQRESEAQARRTAVRFTRSMLNQGATKQEAAGRLGISRRTLLRWEGQFRVSDLRPRRLGRPPRRSDVATRLALLEQLSALGPATGEEPLRALFPTVARREIRDLLGRYRSLYARRHGVVVCELDWLVTGAVWAIDFAVPPSPIDSTLGAALAVRDLGSAKTLVWRGSEGMTATELVVNVRTLFSIHGPPLVLKSDRGSAFISDAFAALLREQGVVHLLSPPHWPPYNGSVESAIGWLKSRTEWQASSRGRPAEWSSDDLERARTLTNALARRPGAPSPDGLWESRGTPRIDERSALATRLEALRAQVRAESAARDEPLDDDAIERQAIGRALVARGLLSIRRRSIPLPKKLLRRANIS